MATLLKWKEPGILRKQSLKGVSLWARFRYRCQVPFISGVIAGVIIAMFHKSAMNSIPVIRYFYFIIFVAILFTIIYGLASFIPAKILIRHDHIGREHGNSYSRYIYSDLRNFHIDTVTMGEESVGLLTLERNDGSFETLEIGSEVNTMILEEILNSRIREQAISA